MKKFLRTLGYGVTKKGRVVHLPPIKSKQDGSRKPELNVSKTTSKSTVCYFKEDEFTQKLKQSRRRTEKLRRQCKAFIHDN